MAKDKGRRRLTAFFIAAAFAATIACSGGDSPKSPEAPPSEAPAAEQTEGAEEPGALAESAPPIAEEALPPAAELPDAPPATLLRAEPSLVAPGETVTVTITAEGGTQGAVMLVGAEGEAASAALSNGAASLTIPATAPDGTYLIVLENSSAFTAVRVSATPTIVLSADRRYVATGDSATLRITAAGIPEDTLVVLFVGDPEALADDTAIESDAATAESSATEPAAPAVLAPSKTGRLIPSAPKPLREFLNRPLTLSSDFTGPLQVISGDEGLGTEETQADSEIASNVVALDVCDGGGEIRGTLPGPGLVRAIWVDGAVHAAATAAEGPFTLAAGPGPVIVIAVTGNTPTDYGPAQVQAVDVPCGGFAEVTIGGSVRHLPSQAESRVEDGRATPQLLSTAPHPAPAPVGARAATADAAQPCRSILVYSVTDIGTNAPWDWYVAGELQAGLPRASVLAQSDIRAILDFEALRQLLGADEGSTVLSELAGALNVDFAVIGRFGSDESLNVSFANLLGFAYRDTDTSVRAANSAAGGALEALLLDQVVPTFVEKMQHAAICGEVDPVSKDIDAGEQTDLTYRVTDLGGLGADGATVTISEPSLGTLDPQDGDVGGDTFTTTYTAKDDSEGTERLTFDAQWAGPAGSVRTRSGETTATIRINSRWTLQMTADLAGGEYPGEFITMTWEGTFSVDQDGQVSGEGSAELTGSAQGRENGVPCGPLQPFGGSYTFGIVGEKSDAGEFVLAPTLRSSQYRQIPGGGTFGCLFVEGLFALIGPELFKLIAGQPQLFVDTQEIRIPAVSGSRVSLPMSSLEGTLEVTIEKASAGSR